MCVPLTLQAYRDDKKSVVSTEFKKLVNEWPVDVISRQTEEEDKKVQNFLCLFLLNRETAAIFIHKPPFVNDETGSSCFFEV